MVHPEGCFDLSLRLAGEHNRCNALVASAAALALGIDETAIREGLAGLRPVPGRLCPLRTECGAWLVDDSYNANPDSVAAALALLSVMPGPVSYTHLTLPTILDV